MGQHTINLTTEQDNAISEMLGSGNTLEDYIKKIADVHIKQKLDEDWANLTDAEKKTKLES